jgi:hypothetical protein
MEQLKFSKILTAFGIFMLGYQTMQVNFNDLSWAINSMQYICIFSAIGAVLLGNFLERKNN